MKESLKSYRVKEDNWKNNTTTMEIVTTKGKYYPVFKFKSWINYHGQTMRDYGDNNIINFCKNGNIDTYMYMSDYLYDKSYDK